MEDRQEEVTRIDTSGHFRSSWLRGVESNLENLIPRNHFTATEVEEKNPNQKINLQNNKINQEALEEKEYDRLHFSTLDSNYDIIGELPEQPQELLIHIHGWRNNEREGVERIKQVKKAYANKNYEHPVIGLNWDSKCAWWNAKETADLNAQKVSHFLIKYKKENPQTTLRIQGHSLGCRVVAETLKNLHKRQKNDIVTTAVFLGGAVKQKTMQTNQRYGKPVEKTTQHAENYYWPKDKVLKRLGYIERTKFIGNQGCPKKPPKNYTDHKVTIKDHSQYYVPKEGIIEKVIEGFQC